MLSLGTDCASLFFMGFIAFRFKFSLAKVLIYLTLAVFCGPGFISLVQAQECLLSYQAPQFKPLISLKKFKTLLKQAPEYRKQLESTSLKIVKVQEEIANSGITHRGVYRVQLEDGKNLILKIALEPESPLKLHVIDRDSRESLITIESNLDQSFVIQNILAEQNLAPKIYGVLNKPALEELAKEFRRVNPWLDKNFLDQEKRIGILMEEIPDAWNGAGQAPINYPLPKSPQLLRKKIQAIYQALSFYQIYVADLQIFMSTNSHAYLADLDFAVHTPNLSFDYSKHTEPEYQNFIEKIQSAIPFAESLNKKSKAPDMESFLLEEMQNLHQQGKSFQQISKWLNKNYPRSLRGKYWRSDDVSRVLVLDSY